MSGFLSNYPYWPGLRLLLLALVIFLALPVQSVHSEGSVELGGNQGLQKGTILYVIIADPVNEVITWTGTGDIKVFWPSETMIGTITSGGMLSVTAYSGGAYRIELDSNQPPGSVWDIGVENAGVPQPGRLYSTSWRLDGGGSGMANALTGVFFAIINEGEVVEIKLDGYAGGVYQINATSTGPEAPPQGPSFPVSWNTIGPEFQIYLNPPDYAPYAEPTPTASDFVLSGGDTGCTAVAPGYNNGNFEFSTGIQGVAYIMCDLNGDMVFDFTSFDDLLLQKKTQIGPNTIVWNGTYYDPTADEWVPLPPATYSCKLRMNAGQFHFISNDVETSYPGLRLFSLDGTLTASPLDMFWNDGLVQSNAVQMPNLQFGLETSGPLGINSGTYSDPADPNVNAHSWGNFTDSGKGDNGVLDSVAIRDFVELGPIPVTILDGTLDTDNDGLLDIAEECTFGTDFTLPDTDGDNLSDYTETTVYDILTMMFYFEVPVDTDLDGTIDALDTDSDNDTIPDLTETDIDADGDLIPNFRDTDDDEDGLQTSVEVMVGTNHYNPDSDGDLILDYFETDGGLPVDTDMDGTIDALDLDSDADTIPDLLDGDQDTDMDGTPNYRDLDSDGDGLLDSIELFADPDMDFVPAFLDADDDNDGAPTRSEILIGTFHLDPDSDDDGIDDGIETNLGFAINSDGDGLIDAFDLDSDNDTIPDMTEGGTVDTDGDTILDFRDPDDDHDLLSTAQELVLGTNPYNADTDGDGIWDVVESNLGIYVDSDGDGTQDPLDLDSDNDTIPDVDEGTSDIDGDLVLNFRDTDDDGDGLLTSYEAADGLIYGNDVDMDTFNNWYDINSDSDAFDDDVEGVTDLDMDTIPNYLDPDSGGDLSNDPDGDNVFTIYENLLMTDPFNPDTDGDGIDDGIETDGGFPVNSDGDGMIDALDLDSDDDGFSDMTEGTTDTDSNGVADYRDPDDDGDGVPTDTERIDSMTYGNDINMNMIPNWHDPDADGDNLDDGVDGTGDTDMDGIPDYLDPDSGGSGVGDTDGDGVPDSIEDIVGSDKYLPDTDGDGIGDYVETDMGLFVDTDGDLKVDATDLDSDNDLRADAIEGVVDTDGDDIPDYRDPDDDGDGLTTLIETLLLPTDPLLADSDGDGIDDWIETDGGFLVDTDGDLTIDALDLDTDADTVPDLVEGAGDADMDGIPNFRDPDANNDGTPDGDQYPGDSDGDGILDFLDTDGYNSQLSGKTFSCTMAASPNGGGAWDLAMLYLMALAGLWWRILRKPDQD